MGSKTRGPPSCFCPAFRTEPFSAFSPDGKQLVYSQEANNGFSAVDTSLEIMEASGAHKRTLHYEKGVASFDGIWSAASDTILFCVGRYVNQWRWCALRL